MIFNSATAFAEFLSLVLPVCCARELSSALIDRRGDTIVLKVLMQFVKILDCWYAEQYNNEQEV